MILNYTHAFWKSRHRYVGMDNLKKKTKYDSGFHFAGLTTNQVWFIWSFVCFRTWAKHSNITQIETEYCVCVCFQLPRHLGRHTPTSGKQIRLNAWVSYLSSFHVKCSLPQRSRRKLRAIKSTECRHHFLISFCPHCQAWRIWQMPTGR